MKPVKMTTSLAFVAGVLCTLGLKAVFDESAYAQVRMTPRTSITPAMEFDASRATQPATQADLDAMRSDIASLKTQLAQTAQDTAAAKLTANLANNWINVAGAPAVAWVGANGTQLVANVGQQASENQTIVSDLNQIQTQLSQQASNTNQTNTQLTDVQHRQVTECLLVADIFAAQAAPLKFTPADKVNMCNGAYWNPGIVSTWLKQIIPFAY